jgi:cysteine desulfurase/selenocysteine lyase
MSLKPKKVIEAVSSYYETYSANIYRGIYQLSEKATEVYEKTREKVAKLLTRRRLKK